MEQERGKGGAVGEEDKPVPESGMELAVAW